MAEKLWDGRFSNKTHASVEAFTSSIDFDKRLYAHDIEGSIAHCRMLAKTGVIQSDEADALVKGLRQIKKEIETGDFLFSDSLEDIHMHIEARLAGIVGDAARKLHTARSRNDQVALDIRMYLRDECRTMIHDLNRLRNVIVAMADDNIDVVMPGYTHLQRAQPVLFAHHLMAYYEMFTRDAERFEQVFERIDVMPLGSAALAGTTYPIDRLYTAELLDFSKVSENSMDAVSDRDFMIEFLSNASICMMHLSRISEELIMWSSSEFAFIDLPDAFATGSSIMPQKKNPDIPELVRGKTGRVYGNLMAMLTMMKSLPLAYNRDMQEDKLPLFDTIDTLSACIDVYIHMLPNIKIDRQRMINATTVGYLNATDMADYLATKGMPFREAHACVGKAVAQGLAVKKELHEMSLDELKEFSQLIEEDLFEKLDTLAMINRRNSYGATSSNQVKAAITAAQKKLDKIFSDKALPE